MMNFDEFVKNMETGIKEIMSSDFPEVSVEQLLVQKPQCETFTSIVVSEKEGSLGVSVNANELYKMLDEKTYNDVLNMATVHATDALNCSKDYLDTFEISDYYKVKNSLVVELINIATNKEVLATAPYAKYKDLALVYRVVVGSNNKGEATVLVDNRLLKKYNVSFETLHKDALNSSAKIRPAVFKSMRETYADLLNCSINDIPEDNIPLYVLTNSKRVQGASAIFYPGVMQEIAEKVGGSYFILPSSIHEVLITPDDGTLNAKELLQTVLEVNSTEVSAEDKLADNVYRYDADARTFSIAD